MSQVKQEEKSLVEELQLDSIIQRDFPKIDFAFGYGSGVFRQIGYDYSKDSPMIDLIFGVQDADEWHRMNLIKNPSHYSGLGYYLGSSYLHFLQQYITPVHFNPSIQVDSFDQKRKLNIKYGVVDVKQLSKDLLKWNILTCSGRLHKPVKIIQLDQVQNPTLNSDLRVNLIQATAISLLLNFKPYIEMKEFLMTIASLSYIGDVRFLFGAENKNKIQNLVEGNYDRFTHLYKDVIEQNNPINSLAQVVGNRAEHIKLETNSETVYQLVNCLPDGLGLFARTNEINVKIINLEDVQRQIIERIRKINMGSSQKLILYNTLATSPTKNIYYVFKKLQKGILKR
ncbi:matrix MMP37 protein (macronuclear) [Tetrahymena thermophila SB210]|uniref:Phosphatidate cytidylyltransferase, mitochondrial n=1 Tax=Tetrahymena thermophila (strain SB210) TaxID=312017 RepID=I7M213_TETTS|nr:matrix MMP37 protein [Tetrahymena thermophila SB210]EAR98282.1 matrix MMP37 protein [Tetrahymena thermophila SB210]|eukprot:XP_001018527.1 matrix MMP37 protein [Tetrahymena thermophila SB210]